jgi:hypothetical protein
MRCGGAGGCGAQVCQREHQAEDGGGSVRASRCCARACGARRNFFLRVFTARLKPCPDTCMVDGCGVAVQADVGC